MPSLIEMRAPLHTYMHYDATHLLLKIPTMPFPNERRSRSTRGGTYERQSYK